LGRAGRRGKVKPAWAMSQSRPPRFLTSGRMLA